MRKNLLTMDVVLAKEIKYMLEEKQFLPGNKLPSERILAETFHVQRLTIRNALNILLQEHVIYALPRKGYFVSTPRIIRNTNPFTPLEHVDFLDIQYKLYSFEIIQPDLRLSNKMLISKETLIYQIVKISYENHQPIAIEYSYIPCDIIPNLSAKAIKSQATTMVLNEIAQHDITNSNQKITLVYSNDFESKLLNIIPGTPVMKHKGLVYDNQGRLILFTENIMLMNRFSFFRKAKENSSTRKD